MCEATVRGLSPWVETDTTVAAAGFGSVVASTVCAPISIGAEAAPARAVGGRELAMDVSFSNLVLIRRYEVD